MDKLEDELVNLIEPVLKKYKESVRKDLDYRNFAAHDIAKLVICTLFRKTKESPTGMFIFDSHDIYIYGEGIELRYE